MLRASHVAATALLHFCMSENVSFRVQMQNVTVFLFCDGV